MQALKLSLFLSLPLALALGSCASGPDSELSTSASMPDVDLAALQIPNATTANEGMLCTGQLSPEQMDALAAAGFQSFVSLRRATENGAGWEEAHASTTGLDFQRLEIAGAAGIDEAHARELREMLEEVEKPVVLYCGSSNRVGALIGLAAMHVDGKSAEEAYEIGVASGVTGLDELFRKQLGLGE